MLRIPLTVAEVRDRATLGLRVAVCRQCFRRPPGSEALGSDVPRSCQAGCEVFEHLPRLARAAACVDPMLGPHERPLGQLIERICTGADGPGRGCPLYRYRGEVVGVLVRVAGGGRLGAERSFGMATRRIREFLDGNHAKYVLISHSPAYTAQEVAESAHVPGRELAKTVVVRLDGRLALAVVPATRDVDMGLLRLATGALYVGLAEESEFADRFEGCQLGAMPPFGNLFGMDTVADERLTEQDLIAFNAGSHTDVIAMRFADWRRLVRPTIADISMPAGVDFVRM